MLFLSLKYVKHNIHNLCTVVFFMIWTQLSYEDISSSESTDNETFRLDDTCSK